MTELQDTHVRDASGGDQAEILTLVAPLRRFVLSRASRPGDVDDVVQETLTRVLAVRGRLEDVTLTAYAFTVARNLLANLARDEAMTRRHAPRLVDLREPDSPEHLSLAAESRRALAAALAELPAAQRELFLAHVVDDQPMAALAGADGAGVAALAAQLGRARARLRVDYVLALRRVQLETPRCRPVLLAVSAGDRRRQAALRAGPHLLNCATCADLSEPLMQRERRLAGVLPWLPLGALHGRLSRLVRHHPAQSAVTGTAVAAAAVTAVVLATSGSPAPRPASPASSSSTARPSTPSAPAQPPASSRDATLVGPAGPVLPVAASLRTLVGQRVTARGVQVLAVPADEGFWVGRSAQERVWVQLLASSTGGESPEHIRVGQRLSFQAVVVRNGDGFAARVGLSNAEGASELTGQEAHLQVPADAVRVQR